MKNNKNSVRGRPYGGTAVLIKNDYKSALIAIKKNHPRIFSIELQSDFDNLLIINVYFPCNTSQNSEQNFACHNKLQNIISNHSGLVLVAGDFNASPLHANFTELQRMCRQNKIDFVIYKYYHLKLLGLLVPKMVLNHGSITV